MRLRLTTIPLAVLVLAFFCASATAVAPAKVKKHDVDLTWNPDDQDLVPGRIVLDTFDSFGPPFGHDVAVETLTPRSQIGSDTRSGKWRVSVNPPAHGPDPGRCVGGSRSNAT